jgi:hypothetical protein
MTVLLLGVVYWFWTQNQYLQRKLNTVETIVYEMRSAFNGAVSAPDAILDSALLSAPAPVAKPVATAAYAPPPTDAEDDEETDDLVFHDRMMATEEGVGSADQIAEFEDLDVSPVSNTVMPPASFSAPAETVATVADLANWGESPLLAGEGGSEADLQPGGGAAIKEFVQPDAEASGNVLDGMTLKELRRLGEQKSIPNAKSLKKHELIAAIRSATRPINVMEATLSLQ